MLIYILSVRQAAWADKISEGIAQLGVQHSRETTPANNLILTLFHMGYSSAGRTHNPVSNPKENQQNEN